MPVGKFGRPVLVCAVFVSFLGLTYVTINGPGSIAQLGVKFRQLFSRAKLRPTVETPVSNSPLMDNVTPLPGIRRPPVEKAGESRLADDTPVLGVSIAGHDRAYSCSALSSPLAHVINDLIGGRAVTVTYCDRNAVARVLTDPDRSEPLSVGFHSIIRDQMRIDVAGRAFDQVDPELPLADLEFTRTTWGAWRTEHPASDVYSMVYVFSDVKLRISGLREPETKSADEAELSDKTRVIGVTTGTMTRAYVELAMGLPETHVINDLFGDDAITVTFCDRCNCVRVLTEPQSGRPLDVMVGGFVNSKLALEIDGRTFSQDDEDLPLSEHDFTRTSWGQWKAEHPETDVYVGKYSEASDTGLGD